MEIKVLGAGCYNCLALERTVFDVLGELDIVADVEVVRDVKKIGEYGIPGMPALLVNGKTKVYGRVPRKEELKAWIREEM